MAKEKQAKQVRTVRTPAERVAALEAELAAARAKVHEKDNKLIAKLEAENAKLDERIAALQTKRTENEADLYAAKARVGG